MAENVGSRLGVGPATVDKASSQAAPIMRDPTISASREIRARRIPLLLLERRDSRARARGDDEHAFHLLVAVSAVLRADNLVLAWRRRRELDDDRLAAPRDHFRDLELLDADPVHAVRRRDDEPNRLALHDLDA